MTSPLEIILKDLKAVPWQGIGKVLNSKMGLAVFVVFMINYSCGPELKAIKQNTDTMADALQETRRIVNADHELLIRIMERCEVRGYSPDRNNTAQVHLTR